MTRTAWQGCALLALWAVSSVSCAAGAGMYKWTDDQGVVHYSDQMPPDALNKGGVVFDKQGRPIKKIEPTPTPAQLKAKEAEDERLRAVAKVQEDKARRDSALLHSYTSEEEIEFARSRAISAIESQLKSAEEYNTELTRRAQELHKQRLAAGKAAPAALDNELASLDEELARQAKVLAQRKGELAAINAKYETDKQRWRDIKAEQQKSQPPAAPTAPAPAPSGKSSASAPTAAR